MNTNDTRALLAHILERFHETHRRELPRLLAAAREGTPALAAPLAYFAERLEAHMFKEEMRLFPMMEQGGNTLIVHLIADMAAEHRAHEIGMEALREAVEAANPPPALGAGLDKLLADLAEHIRVEDEVLFPLFTGSVAGQSA